MVTKPCTQIKKVEKFDWLTSNDGYFLICNEMLCDFFSIELDRIKLYSCQIFLYLKQG